MSQGLDWSGEELGSKEPDGLDIRAILWERKWLLIFFALVGGALGYLQFSKKPPSYQSHAEVLVQRNEAQLPLGGLTQVGAARDPLDTHLALFHAPILLKPAVEQLQLDELPSLSGSSNPMGTISANLSVRRSSSSNDIIHLTYTCGVKNDAQRILEAVVASYLSYLGESQRSTSNKTLELITKAKDELAASLALKEEAYQKFRESASLLWSGDEGSNIHQQRLAQIESERSNIMIQMSQIKAELDSFKRAIEQGVSRQALLVMADQAQNRAGGTGSGAASSQSITSQLIPLLLEEALLLETLGENHPDVLEVRTKIDVMQRLLEKEAGGEKNSSDKPRPDLLSVYLQSLQEELRVGNEKIKELDNLFLAEQKAAKALGAEENRNRALREDLERTKGLFDVVLEQLQEVRLTKDNFTFSGEVLKKPSIAGKVQIEMYSYIFSGGGLGLLFGILIGILMEFGDKRFRSPEEMMQTLRVPILGHIPEMASARNLKKLRDERVDRTVANYHRPQSRIAEAYRLVRTSLLFDAKEGRCSVIQFTSPEPGDGKSTICANVAVAIANSGKRVLVLDADLRRPKQHKLFGIEREVGVTSVIQNGDELQDAIQDTLIPDLQILAAGARTDHPSEMLHSDEMASILEVLRDKYDFILVDSPPVLAVSDAAALAQISDSVLLVLKNTKHCRPRAKQAREALELVDATVKGIVVNSVSEETGYRYEAGQYRRGIYGYGYGSSGYYNRAYRGYYENKPPRETSTRFSPSSSTNR